MSRVNPPQRVILSGAQRSRRISHATFRLRKAYRLWWLRFFDFVPLRFTSLRMTRIECEICSLIRQGGLAFEDIVFGSDPGGLLRKIRDKCVVRIRPLLPVDLQNPLPRRPQAMRCGWHVVLDELSKFGEIEKRDGGEHVVFDVVLHVPIEKCGQPRASVGPAGEPVVGHVWRQTEVLGRPGEETEPAAGLGA